MAIQTLTSSGSFRNLSISGTTSKAGNMSWSLPTLPAGATITGTTLTAALTISMTKGSGTVTINGKSYTASSSLTLDLGTTTKTSLAVSAKGSNRTSRGTVSISNIVYTITYEDGQGSSKYTVRFLDATGNAVSTQEIAHGSSATPPDLPVTNGYLYLGWNGGYTNITQDTDITANYVQEQGTPSNNALSLNWSVLFGATIIQATRHSIAINVTSDWGGVIAPYPESFKGRDIPFSIGSRSGDDGYLIIYNDDTSSNIAVIYDPGVEEIVNVPTGVNASIRFTAELPGIIYNTDLCAIDDSTPTRYTSELAEILYNTSIWNVFGDSISEGYNVTEAQTWHSLISSDNQFSNITKYNTSLSSSAITDGGRVDSFIERYTQLNADADLVTIFGGVNDYLHNMALGNKDDTVTTTFYGAINTLIPGIKSQCPNARIIWMSPMKTTAVGAWRNEIGFHLLDYIQAIQYKCREFNIEYIDLYEVGELDPEHYPGNYEDELHPTPTGHSVLKNYLLNVATVAVPPQYKNVTLTFTAGKGINSDTGEVIDAGSTYFTTVDLYDVTPNTQYFINVSKASYCFIAYYDANNSHVDNYENELANYGLVDNVLIKSVIPANATKLRMALVATGVTNVTGTLITVGTNPPVINIQSQDVTKISGVSGYDRCTVTFIADQELAYWEARATTSSQTPAHGVGLLVESGTLAKGETGYIYVDDEELTNGDLQYRIDIYGKNSSGGWSDD